MQDFVKNHPYISGYYAGVTLCAFSIMLKAGFGSGLLLLGLLTIFQVVVAGVVKHLDEEF